MAIEKAEELVGENMVLDCVRRQNSSSDQAASVRHITVNKGAGLSGC